MKLEIAPIKHEILCSVIIPSKGYRPEYKLEYRAYENETTMFSFLVDGEQFRLIKTGTFNNIENMGNILTECIKHYERGGF